MAAPPPPCRSAHRCVVSAPSVATTLLVHEANLPATTGSLWLAGAPAHASRRSAPCTSAISSVLAHPAHAHNPGTHGVPALKHTQYFFRQRDRVHVHPTCFFGVNLASAAKRSAVCSPSLAQSVHPHVPLVQSRPAAKHTQYFLRQRDNAHVHPPRRRTSATSRCLFRAFGLVASASLPRTTTAGDAASPHTAAHSGTGFNSASSTAIANATTSPDAGSIQGTRVPSSYCPALSSAPRASPCVCQA